VKLFTPPSSERKTARFAIHRALAEKEWISVDLSKATKLSLGTVHNLVSGTNISKTGRALIEAALGVKIWSTEPASPEQPAGQPLKKQRT